jgi:hypothetical protein
MTEESTSVQLEEPMKTHLVAYEYGSGAAWGYIVAESREAIAAQVPEVEIHDAPPVWMTEHDVEVVRQHATVEVGNDAVDRILEGKKLIASA